MMAKMCQVASTEVRHGVGFQVPSNALNWVQVQVRSVGRQILQGDRITLLLFRGTLAGAVLRLRPVLMTVLAGIGSLGPLLWESGISSDVMKPTATPIVGGMLTSTVAVMLLVPILSAMLKGRSVALCGCPLTRNSARTSAVIFASPAHPP